MVTEVHRKNQLEILYFCNTLQQSGSPAISQIQFQDRRPSCLSLLEGRNKEESTS